MNDYALYVVLAVVGGLVTYLFLDWSIKKLIILVMPHYNYVWYDAFEAHHGGKVIAIPGGFINKDVMNHLYRQYDIIDDLRNQLKARDTRQITQEKDRQLSFIPPSKSGYSLTVPYLDYLLTFKNPLDKAKFDNSDQHVWVERKTYIERKNNPRVPQYWYGWVRYSESENDKGDTVFNPKTDTPLIKEIPPVWPDGEEKGELIPMNNLPFSWKPASQQELTPFSVKRYEMFKENNP